MKKRPKRISLELFDEDLQIIKKLQDKYNISQSLAIRLLIRGIKLSDPVNLSKFDNTDTVSEANRLVNLNERIMKTTSLPVAEELSKMGYECLRVESGDPKTRKKKTWVFINHNIQNENETEENEPEPQNFTAIQHMRPAKEKDEFDEIDDDIDSLNFNW